MAINCSDMDTFDFARGGDDTGEAGPGRGNKNPLPRAEGVFIANQKRLSIFFVTRYSKFETKCQTLVCMI